MIRALVSIGLASVVWAQNFGIGTPTPTERLDVEGGRLRVRVYSGAGIRVATVDPNGVFGVIAGNAAGDILQWNGTDWVAAPAPSATAQTQAPLQGNGTAGSPITFQNGTAAGQVWQWNGTQWVLATISGDNWGTQTAVVNAPLTGNGTAANPIGLTPGTAAGQVLTWNGTNWVAGTAPGDNWGTQTAVTGGPITGTGVAGNPITFANGTAAGQVWQWNGTQWVLATISGDNWGTQTAVVNAPLTGNGTAANPIGLTPGTAAGQVLLWNGTNWVAGTAPGDNWGTQTAVTGGPITGTGVAGNPITFVNGTAAGQVWQWNGTQWVLATISGDDWGAQTAVVSAPLTGNGTTANPIGLQPGGVVPQILLWNPLASQWQITNVPVQNGLNFNLTNPPGNPAIELGGALVRNTDIPLSGFNLTFSGATGNVGIGTTTPTQRLHVDGNLRLEGAFMPGNNAGTTGWGLVSQGAGVPPIWVSVTTKNNTHVAYSTTSVTVSGTTWWDIAGPITLTLPAGARVLAYASGGALPSGVCYASAEIRISVNGNDFPNGAYTKETVDYTTPWDQFDVWTLMGVYDVPSAGNYTFRVQAARVPPSQTGCNLIMGGDNTTVTQATLILIVFP